MKTPIIRSALVGLVIACCQLFGPLGPTRAGAPAKRMLSHDVYFTLEDNSEKAAKKLVAACKEHLSGHPGTVWFSAGRVVKEHQREVNDRDFDVALHIVFKDKASHDKYQNAPKHHKFIEECEANWKAVRVFDSWLDATSHGAPPAEAARRDAPRKPRLPDPAALFAGMIQGKVVAKHDGQIVVAVEKVVKVWKTNKAESPEALVGKKVLVEGPRVEGHPVKTVARFIETLKVGETVAMDVAHRQGEALTILELTEQQRQRAREQVGQSQR